MRFEFGPQCLPVSSYTDEVKAFPTAMPCLFFGGEGGREHPWLRRGRW